MDALLNFETVKLFGNGLLEVRQYDASLTSYQASSTVQQHVGGGDLHVGVTSCSSAPKSRT